MVGSQIGAYRLVQQIGEGGMGAVFRAEHVMLGRPAAVKVLHGALSRRPEIVARFFNEARAATSVSDPGIVQVFDFGHHTDGSAYLVMELLDGEPLDRRLARVRVMPLVEALRVARQVASSLGAAHARGIIHRDMKPENIFLARDHEVAGGERAKILDFGIAKLTDGSGHKTQTQAMLGTPLYMSPEQCRGAGQVDHRADIYALGCVVMALVTGAPPFDSDALGELIVAHMQSPPPAPSARVAGLPPELDAIVLRCLEKDPARRFATAGELAQALDHLLALLGAADGAHVASAMYPATPAMISAARAAGGAPTTLSAAAGARVTSGATGTGTVATSGGNKKFLIAGGLVAGAAAVAIALIATQGASKPAQVAAAEPTAVAPMPAPAPAPVAKPTPVAKPAPAPAPQPVAPAVDPHRADAIAQIVQAVTTFSTWTKTHATSPCPPLAALGIAPADPWGTPLVLTCTDQPGDQIVGVTSAGPDRALGTADDLESWQLADVVKLAHGARWQPKAVAAKLPAHPPTQPAKIKATSDDDGDGIPDKR